MPYQPYWKSEFQNHLTSMKGKGSLIWWEEVSDELESGSHKIWEYVYRFNLINPSASIIIFSSVYKETDRSREINSDAVRIIYEWKTRNGLIYSKIAKKYRVDTLFENLEAELVAASNDNFDLQKYDWVNSIQETDVQ